MKIKTSFKLGYMSEAGYRHFPLAYFAYGTNGFTLTLIGCSITIKLWEENKSNLQKVSSEQIEQNRSSAYNRTIT